VEGQLLHRGLHVRRVPGWIRCELCERHSAYLPARLVMVVDEEKTEDKLSLASSLLALLCPDCAELVGGTINDEEWKRRTNFQPA